MRSTLSCLVIDSVETLVGVAPGDGSEGVNVAHPKALATLSALLQRKPPPGRNLLVLLTTSSPKTLERLGLGAGGIIDADVVVPTLTTDQSASALVSVGAFADVSAAREAVTSLGRDTVPIKSLLSTARVAKAMSQSGVDLDAWRRASKRTRLARS